MTAPSEPSMVSVPETLVGDGGTTRTWPGDEWCGFFTRTTLHHVEVGNSERLGVNLGLSLWARSAYAPVTVATTQPAAGVPGVSRWTVRTRAGNALSSP